jgi:hypothetical protein
VFPRSGLFGMSGFNRRRDQPLGGITFQDPHARHPAARIILENEADDKQRLLPPG